MTLEIDRSQLALRRAGPGADPTVLAVAAAAVELAWPRPAPADQHHPAHMAWRFSGRWWSKPLPLRRARPWERA